MNIISRSGQLYYACLKSFAALLFFLGCSNPVFAQENIPYPEEYSRGGVEDPSYKTFVVPLSNQKGLKLHDTNDTQLVNGAKPWFLKLNRGEGDKRYHFNGANMASPGLIRNPIVAFGDEAGGTPLYLNQSYHFGFYAGGRMEWYVQQDHFSSVTPSAVRGLSSNWNVGSNSTEDFESDNNYIVRTDTNPGSIIYECREIGEFNLRIFYKKSFALKNLVFEYSKQNNPTSATDWTVLEIGQSLKTAALVKDNINANEKWYANSYYNSKLIPKGVSYLRITLKDPNQNVRFGTLKILRLEGGTQKMSADEEKLTFGEKENLTVEESNAEYGVKIRRFKRPVDPNGVPTEEAPIYLMIPRRPRPNETAPTKLVRWNNFVSAGFQVSDTKPDMDVTLKAVDIYNNYNIYNSSSVDKESRKTRMWGVDISSPYILTHKAKNSEYFYIVEASGMVITSNGTERRPMVTKTAAAYQAATPMAGVTHAPLYAVSFNGQPQALSAVQEGVFFHSQPMPSLYYGKSVRELKNISGQVELSPTSITQLNSNQSSYLELDKSLDFYVHPKLDKLVEDLNKDPIAIANYVINEIKFSGGVGRSRYYNADYHSLTKPIEPGVSRGALMTYLEKAGTPTEQCALLIYLLRRAGYPAAYIYPKIGGIKMYDQKLSEILGIQLRGSIGLPGDLRENADPAHPFFKANDPSLIPIEYPWVAVKVNGTWRNIFPWIKDTEVHEGLDLYSLFPEDANTGLKWARKYLRKQDDIFKVTDARGINRTLDADEDDTIRALFPIYVNKVLEGHPGVSIDDVGMKIVRRSNYYLNWDEFPRPFETKTDQIKFLKNLDQTSINSASLSNRIKIEKVRFELKWTDAKKNNFQHVTADVPVADWAHRKIFIYYENNQLVLHMDAYRPGISGQSNFHNFGVADKLCKQERRFDIPLNTKMQIGMFYTAFPGSQNNEATVWGGYRPLDAGTYAAYCYKVNTVTPEMLQIYAEKFWETDKKTKENPQYKPPIEEWHGNALYLMALSYFEKCSRFEEFSNRIHKEIPDRRFCGGTTRFKATEKAVIPQVDMLAYMESSLYDPYTYGVRSDLPAPFTELLSHNQTLQFVNFSAEEHNVLKTFVKDNAAKSTVSILHKSGADLIELNKYNYKTYKANLQLFWADVAALFEGSGSNEHSIAFFNKNKLTKVFLGLSSGFFTAKIQGLEGGIGNSQLYSYAGSSLGFSNNNYSLSLTNSTVASYAYHSPVSIFNAPAQLSLNTGFSTVNLTNQVSASIGYSSITNQALEPINYNTAYSAVLDFGFIGTPVLNTYAPSLISDPVNVMSGEFYIDAVDLTLAGPMPLEIRRNYLSKNVSDNQFGYGWKMNYMPFLVMKKDVDTNPTDDNDKVIYAAEKDGSVVAYERKTSTLWEPTVAENKTLINIQGNDLGSTGNLFNNKIEKTVVDGKEIYTLSGSDGSTRIFEVRAFPLTGDGNVISRRRPYLTKWKDNRGNFYRFIFEENSSAPAYGQVKKIESSNGSFLGFNYDVYGHIIEAYTDDGRRIKYEYNSFGDLIKVTRPDNSLVQYEYKQGLKGTQLFSHHLLTKEIKPDGNILINVYEMDKKHPIQTTKTYGDMPFPNAYTDLNNPSGTPAAEVKKRKEETEMRKRRVYQQYAMVGRDKNNKSSPQPVKNAEFTYMQAVSLNGINMQQTLIVDAFGNATTYWYKDGMIYQVQDPGIGKVISGGAPATQTVSWDWFITGTEAADGYKKSLRTWTDKRGLVTEYKYDSKGNVKSEIITGDLDGNTGNESVTATSAYNANNTVNWTKDQRGIVAKYYYKDVRYPYLVTHINIFNSGVTPANISDNPDDTTYSANLLNKGKNEYYDVFDGEKASYGLLKKVTQAAGFPEEAVTEWTHEVRGFKTSEKKYTGSDDPALITYYRYNGRGEMVEQRDAIGGKTVFDYDAMGRKKWTEVRDENGNLVSWNYDYYDGNGKLIWSDGPRYNPEDYVYSHYDGAGRLVEETRWKTKAKADNSGIEPESGDALFARTSFRFDKFGNQTEIIDPVGNVMAMKYDSIGQLTQKAVFDSIVRNTDGEVDWNASSKISLEQFEYEAGGKVSKEKNSMGGITEYLYTSTGKLKKQINPDGTVLEWRYRADGRQEREILSDKSYWETAYDDTARTVTRTYKNVSGQTQVTYPDIRTFDRRGNEVQMQDIDGYVFTKSYDDLDRVKIVTGPAEGTYSKQQITTYAYDNAGRIQWVKNALGEKTTSISDVLGRPVITTLTSSDNRVISYSETRYSPDHHSYTTRQGKGEESITKDIFTDTLGNVVMTWTRGGGQVVEITTSVYNAAGDLVSSTDARGKTTHYEYDAMHRQAKEILPDNAITLCAYNRNSNGTNAYNQAGSQNGQVVVKTYPGGLKWKTAYDKAGRIRQTENIVNNGSGESSERISKYFYYGGGLTGDPALTVHPEWIGKLEREETPRSVKNFYSYDNFLRISQIISDGSSGISDITTAYSYDKRGNVLTLTQTPVAGSVTTIINGYDGYGQKVSEEVKIGSTTISHYIQEWDERGTRSELGFQLTAQGVGAGRSLAYMHRADGLLEKITDNTGRVYQFGYNETGQLISRWNSWRDLNLLHDSKGRIQSTQTRVAGALDFQETNLWDGFKLARYTTVKEGASIENEVRQFTYNSRGQLITASSGATLADSNTKTQTYRFDFNSNPEATGELGIRTQVLARATTAGSDVDQWKVPGTTSSNNNQGETRITEELIKARLHLATGIAVGATQVQATLGGKTIPVQYDPNDDSGRWTAELVVDPGTDYELDATATHESLSSYTGTASDTVTFDVAGMSGTPTMGDAVETAYDTAGNVTSRTFDSGRIQTLEWNALGQLIKVEQTGSADNNYIWTALYDGLGRRLRSVYDPADINQPTLTIDSHYDPEVEFLELGTTINGERVWKIYGPDSNSVYGGLQGIGGLEATLRERNGRSLGILNDYFGNTVAVIEDTTIRWHNLGFNDYGAFEKGGAPQLGLELGLGQASVWRSKRIDPTGFYYFGARYYEPQSGRFLSVDPMGHAGSLELYGYANGDPVNRHDPDGRYAKGFDAGVSNYLGNVMNKLLGGLNNLGIISENTLFRNTDYSARDPQTISFLSKSASYEKGFMFGSNIIPAAMDIVSLVVPGGGLGKASGMGTRITGAGLKLESGAANLASQTIFRSTGVTYARGAESLLSGSSVVARTTQMEFGFVQAVERQTLARDFYRATTGWNDTRIASHLKGINFDKPVSINLLPKGTVLGQHSFPGDFMGNYFSAPGVPAKGLGIYPRGRIESLYNSMKPTPVLQSTAADIVDTWSVPGWAIEVPGGNQQTFIPNKGIMKKLE